MKRLTSRQAKVLKELLDSSNWAPRYTRVSQKTGVPVSSVHDIVSYTKPSFSLFKKNLFKKSIEEEICPFCGNKLCFYDGALGYEAMKCKTEGCGFYTDYQGMGFEDDK